ncbi:MAG: TetR/AcrR family transcriptional regulator [Hyphomonadaceae bacterium]|nr:TetR/AcrR family transcriptional regulator [Hyphomonadaceae bacterium]
MTHAELPVPAPTRAELRRAQVLEAASKCFNREGFNGASMASIAAEASMSVGQIYRYFENKEAIIAALVEQSMEEWGSRMAGVRARSGDLVEQMIDVARYHAEKVGQLESAALCLEFFAEAARNPRIADIVRLIDANMRQHLRETLILAGAADDDTIDARLHMIVMLIDGWALRAVKDPSLAIEDYMESLRPLFAILLRCGSEDCATAKAAS